MNHQEVKKRSVSAVKWSVAGTGTQFIMQFGVQVLLARMLGPDNYGIFAMCVLVVLMCNLLCEGLSWGIIQARELAHEEACVIFTLQAIGGITIYLLLAFTALPLSSWFHDERVADYLPWVALECMLAAFSATPISLIKRELDFRYLSLAKITSYTVGYVGLGIPLAWLGYGVYALIVASLVQATCMTLLVWLHLPRKLVPRFWLSSARPLTAIGLTAVATNVCNWLLNNLDRVVLSRMLPAELMGAYTVGGNLAKLPGELVLNALQPSFLAAGARIQDNPERLRNAYLSLLSTIWILITPLFVMLSLLASDIIKVLYGQAWLPAAKVLALLAIAIPIYITWGLSTPILWNTGKKHLEALIQIPILIGAAAAFFVFAHDGMLALAMIAAATLLVRGLVTAYIACGRLNISMDEIWPSIFRGVIAISISSVVTWLMANYMRSEAFGSLFVVAASSSATAITLLFLAYIFPSLLGWRVINMLSHFSMSRHKPLIHGG